MLASHEGPMAPCKLLPKLAVLEHMEATLSSVAQDFCLAGSWALSLLPIT